jgi:hypothetical protein
MKPLLLGYAVSIVGLAALFPGHSTAQSKLSPEVLVNFVVAATTHESLLLELEAQCPPAQKTAPFIPEINAAVSALSSDLAKETLIYPGQARWCSALAPRMIEA